MSVSRLGHRTESGGAGRAGAEAQRCPASDVRHDDILSHIWPLA
ncbi:MAG: hypothetical protein KIH64_012600 [Mycobacterium sp.]|nr:hypothetical protein [Mycobacterium sp.]